jgi:phosphoribosylamine--glycine ligase
MKDHNKVLIIGSGGREHAIAQKISQSNYVSEIWVCPGNPGMTFTNSEIKTKNISATDCNALLSFALEEKIDLCIVGPEASLSQGIVDLFRDNGLRIVGPSKVASQLETSKSFAKKIMLEAGVPTAAYCEFFSAASAMKFIENHTEEKMVVKCDGLAAGKGVIVCKNKSEAVNAVSALMKEKLLGENTEHIIIEDFLDGSEVSAFALCDGESFTFLGTACDHKRLRDGDLGPNTGGMGVFAPANIFTETDQTWLSELVINPILNVMKKKNMPFSGILFAGLMKTKKHGWQVLEFNVRFGDPETQVLLPLIEDDLFHWLLAASKGSGEIKKYQSESEKLHPNRKKHSGVHVVMAAHGYPGTEGEFIRSGDAIHFDKGFNCIESEKDYLFFAGVEQIDQTFFTKGGRILGVTSMADSMDLARKKAYQKISQIHFEGAQYRNDIGAKKVRLAILASGNGSNAEAIMKWAASSQLADVVCLGSNTKSAFAITRAEKYNVPVFTVLKKSKNEDKSHYDERLIAKLEEYSPDWIILAGYMKLLTPVFLKKYPRRIINIHPSLLPAFPGLDGYGDAFKAQVKESGCTIHYVDEGIDTGEIIGQQILQLSPGESFEEFKARGLACENQFYPKVIEELLKGNV